MDKDAYVKGFVLTLEWYEWLLGWIPRSIKKHLDKFILQCSKTDFSFKNIKKSLKSNAKEGPKKLKDKCLSILKKGKNLEFKKKKNQNKVKVKLQTFAVPRSGMKNDEEDRE